MGGLPQRQPVLENPSSLVDQSNTLSHTKIYLTIKNKCYYYSVILLLLHIHPIYCNYLTFIRPFSVFHQKHKRIIGHATDNFLLLSGRLLYGRFKRSLNVLEDHIDNATS